MFSVIARMLVVKECNNKTYAFRIPNLAMKWRSVRIHSVTHVSVCHTVFSVNSQTR